MLLSLSGAQMSVARKKPWLLITESRIVRLGSLGSGVNIPERIKSFQFSQPTPEHQLEIPKAILEKHVQAETKEDESE